MTTLTVADDVSAGFGEAHVVLEAIAAEQHAAVDAAADDLAGLLTPHAKAVQVDVIR